MRSKSGQALGTIAARVVAAERFVGRPTDLGYDVRAQPADVHAGHAGRKFPNRVGAGVDAVGHGGDVGSTKSLVSHARPWDVIVGYVADRINELMRASVSAPAGLPLAG